MTSRKTNRKPGRPTKFTPEVQTELYNSIAAGFTDADACARAGITPQTFIGWVNAGRESDDGEYFEFFQSITRARAQARNIAVAAFRSGLVANTVIDNITETFSETRLDKAGKPYTYKRTVAKQVTRAIPPDWRAGRDWLERRDRENWSPRHEFKIDDWRSEYIAAIREGRVDYEALRAVLNDQPGLAEQLFALAGVPIETGRS